MSGWRELEDVASWQGVSALCPDQLHLLLTQLHPLKREWGELTSASTTSSSNGQAGTPAVVVVPPMAIQGSGGSSGAGY